MIGKYYVYWPPTYRHHLERYLYFPYPSNVVLTKYEASIGHRSMAGYLVKGEQAASEESVHYPPPFSTVDPQSILRDPLLELVAKKKEGILVYRTGIHELS